MSDLKGKSQKAIRLGTHGEDYGSWMSNPVFYMVGGLTALAALLAVLSLAVFHIFALGILFVIMGDCLQLRSGSLREKRCE